MLRQVKHFVFLSMVAVLVLSNSDNSNIVKDTSPQNSQVTSEMTSNYARGKKAKPVPGKYIFFKLSQNAAVKVVVDDGNEQANSVRSVYVVDPDCPPNQICPQH